MWRFKLGTVTAKRTETVYGVGVTPSFPQKTALFLEKTVPATAAAAHEQKQKIKKTSKLNEYSMKRKFEIL